MLGSLRWNVATGAAGLLLTFLISLGNNGFAVSCLRALYAFIAMFLVTFLFRFALFLIAGKGTAAEESIEPEQEGVGSTINVTTPEGGEDLNDLLRAQLEGRQPPEAAEFRPLQPKQLVSAQNKDPEELAQIVRHLSERRDNEER